jgi:2-keto-4-pentenoate hydratase
VSLLLRRHVTRAFESTRRAWSSGAPRAGWKIAINDANVQRSLGLSGSLVAALDGTQMLASGARYTAPDGAILLAEAEIALRFSRELAGHVTSDEVRGAIAAVAPAIELVDYQRAARDLEQILANGVFHAATVLGPAHAPDAAIMAQRDAPNAAVASACGDAIALARSIFAAPPDSPLPSLRCGAATAAAKRIALLSPNDLLEAVRHVAALLDRHGEALRSGDWLICGSLVEPARIARGEHAWADFGALGTVHVEIA